MGDGDEPPESPSAAENDPESGRDAGDESDEESYGDLQERAVRRTDPTAPDPDAVADDADDGTDADAADTDAGDDASEPEDEDLTDAVERVEEADETGADQPMPFEGQPAGSETGDMPSPWFPQVSGPARRSGRAVDYDDGGTGDDGLTDAVERVDDAADAETADAGATDAETADAEATGAVDAEAAEAETAEAADADVETADADTEAAATDTEAVDAEAAEAEAIDAETADGGTVESDPLQPAEPATEPEVPPEAPAVPEDDDLGFGDGPESDEELPLADHIEEMVFRLAVVVGVAGTVSLFVFPYGDTLINFIWSGVLPNAANTRPHIYSPLELLITQFKVASLAGIILALPVFVYETYAFMRPGLYPHERRYYLAAIPTSLVLAFVGVVFAYFIVLPAVMTYFLFYSETVANSALALGATFDLILLLMGYLALVFQIPLFVMLAVMMNLTTRRWLEDRRLLFWGAFLGVAFLFSPDPTGVAPVIVAATMVTLFEGTLLLLRWTGR